MDVSVVIATRNRFNHLQHTIGAIEKQTYLPKEIIIVDASDDIEFGRKKIVNKIPIKWIFSTPSVCVQRNIGIKSASSDWILLCDDDVELEQDYLKKIVDYLHQKKDAGAVAGLFMQQENGVWVKNYPIKKFTSLLWAFFFQQGIWGSIESVKSPFLLRGVHKFIISFYKRRGNTQTIAGWPLITDWSGDVFQTKFYSIGANTVVKKEWLLNSPYDENLDVHGIGDNYGVALGFEGKKLIHVLTNALAYHHRASENRYDEGKAKSLRILALDYFLRKNKSNFKTSAFLIWSVLGYCLYALLRKRNQVAELVRTLFKVLFNRNPLKI